MSDALSTYLHDHLAGSNFAIELLKHLHDEDANEPLGRFAAGLLVEVEEDRQVLQTVIHATGTEPSTLKEAAAWVAEKVSQLKLNHATAGAAGTFQTLEALTIGIHGKLSLWRALAVVAPTNARLRGPDFDALAARAEAQEARVEEQRLQVAVTALAMPRE